MSEEHESKFNTKGKFRNWCITCYNPPMFDSSKISYYVYQKEAGDKKHREHWQCYIELNCQMRLSEVKKCINDNTAHCEPRFGTQQQAIDYCTKKETRIEEPVSAGKPKMQGNRSELDSIVDSMESGATAREILLDQRGLALKHINMISRGLRILHELDPVDALIMLKRERSSTLKKLNASEVAGNTEPATNLEEELKKLAKLDSQILEEGNKIKYSKS